MVTVGKCFFRPLIWDYWCFYLLHQFILFQPEHLLWGEAQEGTKSCLDLDRCRNDKIELFSQVDLCMFRTVENSFMLECLTDRPDGRLLSRCLLTGPRSVRLASSTPHCLVNKLQRIQIVWQQVIHHSLHTFAQDRCQGHMPVVTSWSSVSAERGGPGAVEVRVYSAHGGQHKASSLLWISVPLLQDLTIQMHAWPVIQQLHSLQLFKDMKFPLRWLNVHLACSFIKSSSFWLRAQLQAVVPCRHAFP